MEKLFVPYNVALQLKALGLIPVFIGVYISKTDEVKITDNHKEHYYLENSAITWNEAFRWFREKHNLYSEICLDSYKEPYSLKVTIKHLDNTNTFVDKEYYPYSNGIDSIDNKNYKEAELECLKKLIEIVKESKS